MRFILSCFLAMAAFAAVAEPFEQRIPLGLIEPDIPLDRPLTKETVTLGKRLFFETRLSRSGLTSCATCHDPVFGYSDPRKVSVNDTGLLNPRNAPSLYNVGFLPTVMWDGKLRTLEAQALDPFKSNGEMGLSVENAVDFLRANTEYVEMFSKAFGSRPNADLMAQAIAAFERTLISGDSPFDQFLFGNNEDALTRDEKLGLEVFSTKAGCLNCHDVFHPKFNPLGGGLALFTDFRFHNLGVGYSFGRARDPGRYYWTRDVADYSAFRTPTLRNLTLTAPYMHDGSLKTLEEVVEFYNRGGNENPNRSPSIHPLFLTSEEKRLLVAFLRSVDDGQALALARSLQPQFRRGAD